MNKELTKTELLLIRAIKSKNPMKRLVSVYKRQYGIEHSDITALLSIIAGIVDDHQPISSSHIVKELNPSRSDIWQSEDYQEQALRVLVSHLRLTEVIKFNGWVSPASIRNKNKIRLVS